MPLHKLHFGMMILEMNGDGDVLEGGWLYTVETQIKFIMEKFYLKENNSLLVEVVERSSKSKHLIFGDSIPSQSEQ